MINIHGLSKATVFKALYDRARPQGMGFLHYKPNPMTLKEAEEIVSKTTYFDYVHGRVMKISIKDDLIDPILYDRDNGPGAAERALADLMMCGGKKA